MRAWVLQSRAAWLGSDRFGHHSDAAANLARLARLAIPITWLDFLAIARAYRVILPGVETIGEAMLSCVTEFLPHSWADSHRRRQKSTVIQ
jgi:hypothetical protein